jgi:hypothetical protein
MLVVDAVGMNGSVTSSALNRNYKWNLLMLIAVEQ